MFVDESTGYVGPPSCVECGVVILAFEDLVQSLLSMCFYDVCFLLILNEVLMSQIHGRLRTRVT